MKSTFLTVLLAAAAVMPLAAHAGITVPASSTPTATPDAAEQAIDNRLEEQHSRLQVGRQEGLVASGMGQTKGTFGGGFARIEKQMTAMKAANGGSLSSADAAKLNTELNARSQRIYAAKHPAPVFHF